MCYVSHTLRPANALRLRHMLFEDKGYSDYLTLFTGVISVSLILLLLSLLVVRISTLCSLTESHFLQHIRLPLKLTSLLVQIP
jgi:hypothetical protein